MIIQTARATTTSWHKRDVAHYVLPINERFMSVVRWIVAWSTFQPLLDPLAVTAIGWRGMYRYANATIWVKRSCNRCSTGLYRLKLSPTRRPAASSILLLGLVLCWLARFFEVPIHASSNVGQLFDKRRILCDAFLDLA